MHYSIYLWLLLIITTVSKGIDDVNIYGTTADGWEYVRDYLKENLIQQRDLGASVAIYYQGELVVDLWGGWFDKTQMKPYDNDTLQLVFSTSKGLVAIATALCVQRGLLDYSALVTKYWPEYGQYGKENTTVADILSHRAGVPFDNQTFDHYLNWTGMIHSLEQQKPIWTPGTKHGYHALTYGWLAGELVRRVDPQKRTLGEFIRDEIAIPLNLEFYFGLPAEQENRVSPLYFKPSGNESVDEFINQTYYVFNSRSAHEAEIPAANGITNARSVARLYASLLGDLDGHKYKRLINEDILKQASKSNTPDGEIDFVLLLPTRFGMGFILMDQIFPSLGPEVFGHNGLGGSIGFAVPSKQFSFAYVMNQMDLVMPDDIDARYKSMLNKIATMINTNNGNVISRISLQLLVFCVFFYYLF